MQCQLTQAVLYDGCKTAVVVVAIASHIDFSGFTAVVHPLVDGAPAHIASHHDR